VRAAVSSTSTFSERGREECSRQLLTRRARAESLRTQRRREGFRVAAGTEGADGVDDVLGGDAIPAQTQEDEGAEKDTGDEGGDEGEKDQNEHERRDVQLQEMFEKRKGVHMEEIRGRSRIGESG